ncbi:MAG: hypothetical protein V9G04_18300 [Nocardioides sp.]|jgi:hypothetical protein
MRKFVYKEQYARPEARRISDGVIMRLDHVYEVDPELMGTHFRQQNMPLWDVERIVSMRTEHLDWMHEHFSFETLVAGEEDETHLGPGRPGEQQEWDYPENPGRHPKPILPW